ncbi:MAG: 30S ribosomal protein S12 methylthiotransferase RimO, partial [Bdellovibrionales bacterium]|nr:30S ribosomal protein S12 methylthiotransferase RimO [Bdellovibrionales bacterium]
MKKLTILNESSSSLSGKGVSAIPTGMATRGEYKGKIAFVTLGCAKNQVDSEVMMGSLIHSGYECVAQVEDADIAVVNTCGFLEGAVEEGIDTILDISELKQNRLRKLIVAGCMVERYGESLRESMPEVDHFIGTNDLLRVVSSVEDGYESPLQDGGRPYFLYDDTLPRYLQSGEISAYVKISEGCDRPCTFCIIPRIRGAMRSRTPDSVVAEIQNLASRGVREVNLVGQDLTDYGRDLGRKMRNDGEAEGSVPTLAELLWRIERETDIPWVRLFYAYPRGINKELLMAIQNCSRVVSYLDLPFQHVNEDLLKSMKRPLGKYAPREIARYIRSEVPGIAFRTTFIVGYPGETEEHISELEAFLREIRFESVGIFEYSPEEGTPAGAMDNQVPSEVKRERREYLMEVQRSLVQEKLHGLIGKRSKVLIQGVHPESELLWVGRSEFQGPEVDGETIINDVHGDIELSAQHVGAFGIVEFTEVAGYDLIGTLVEICPDY